MAIQSIISFQLNYLSKIEGRKKKILFECTLPMKCIYECIMYKVGLILNQ